jgi:xylulokinase
VPASREALLLGVDVGTTRTKALLLDSAGAERAIASVPTPFRASADGVDMDVDDLAAALADAVLALGAGGGRVDAVGLAGMAESGAPFLAGRPLAPIIAWHDGRGEETVASLERRFGSALAGWTGRRVRTVSSVAKLGWLVDHGLARPDRWLGVPEVALFLLTGAEATEYSLAARTGAYHVTERRFVPEVVAHGLGSTASDEAAARLFPPVGAAGTAMGSVTEEAAVRFGLPPGVPVTIAGHDHLAAAAGLGARPDDLLNSVGTAETLLRRLDHAPDVEQALELDLAVSLWPGGDAWAVLASAVRAGLVIEALARHLGLEPGVLDDLAAGGAAGPAATGDRAVGTVALGQGIDVPVGPPAGMWTATLEALARRTAAAAERVAALAGPPGRLVVFGGGSRSPTWLRAKATACGVSVVGCPMPEAAARGAALAAGVAAGWWPTPADGPGPPLDAGAAPAGTMDA